MALQLKGAMLQWHDGECLNQLSCYAFPNLSECCRDKKNMVSVQAKPRDSILQSVAKLEQIEGWCTCLVGAYNSIREGANMVKFKPKLLFFQILGGAFAPPINSVPSPLSHWAAGDMVSAWLPNFRFHVLARVHEIRELKIEACGCCGQQLYYTTFEEKQGWHLHNTVYSNLEDWLYDYYSSKGC